MSNDEKNKSDAGLTVKRHDGREVALSPERYVVLRHCAHPSLRPGDVVRLIAGVDGSPEPGHHFAAGHVTVCPVGADEAQFFGVRTDEVRLLPSG